jgi:hypothetical protein
MANKSIVIAVGVVGFCGLVASGGCKKNKQTTNADLYASYENNEYEEDMVAAHPEDTVYEDQGEGIDARTLANIDDTIRTVYLTSFERCLEQEMERLETRWLGAQFTVEFTIETTGKVSKAKMLEMKAGETKPKDKNNPREADQFDDCVEAALLEWEFDPPPEVQYTHTYNGKVGEAW